MKFLCIYNGNLSMKTKAICSFFVLFAIVAGIGATTPAAFAQAEVTIEPLVGSSGLNICGGETGVECYIPGTVTVDVGGKVIFSNTDSDKHTFSSGTISDDIVGTVFDSGLVFSGEKEYWEPDTTGEFPYFCLVHPWMNGLIIVQEAGAVEETMEEEVMEETMEEEVMEETMEEEVMEETMEEEVMEETMEEEVMEETMEEETMTEETEVVDEKEGGGCLIATATFGSELAPQVQQLRELRDNTILSTESGTAFMTTFNQFYYSFSPTIADLEREQPVFKEVMKLILTPMISSLSLLNHADIDSEQEMLGYGISLIILNIGMYVGIPAFGILKLYQFRKN